MRRSLAHARSASQGRRRDGDPGRALRRRNSPAMITARTGSVTRAGYDSAERRAPIGALARRVKLEAGTRRPSRCERAAEKCATMASERLVIFELLRDRPFEWASRSDVRARPFRQLEDVGMRRLRHTLMTESSSIALEGELVKMCVASADRRRTRARRPPSGNHERDSANRRVLAFRRRWCASCVMHCSTRAPGRRAAKQRWVPSIAIGPYRGR